MRCTRCLPTCVPRFWTLPTTSAPASTPNRTQQPHLVQDAHCVTAGQGVPHVGCGPDASCEQPSSAAPAAVDQCCQQPHTTQRLIQPQLQPRQRQVGPNSSIRSVTCSAPMCGSAFSSGVCCLLGQACLPRAHDRVEANTDTTTAQLHPGLCAAGTVYCAIAEAAETA
jgi:hypothetical protein